MTEGSSSVVGVAPVWPPPSPPCTMTRSAPQAATLTAWRGGPTAGRKNPPAPLHHDQVRAPGGDLDGVAGCADGRHDDHAVLLEPLDQRFLRRQRERGD